MARSKSPYYQAIEEQTSLDQHFKTILKDNQSNFSLWIAFIEIEALMNQEQAFEKIQGLSNKVLKSFEGKDGANIKSIRVSILDNYFRLLPPFSSQRTKEIVTIISMALQVLKDLRINLSSYASDLDQIENNGDEDVICLLSRFGTSFLSLSKLTYKLVTSVVQLTGQSPVENIIDSSFINKKQPYTISDFTVLVVVHAIFGTLAGTLKEESLQSLIQDWFEIHQTKLRQLSNVYVKQFRTDFLLHEIKSTVLILNNLMSFVGNTIPQRYISLATLNAYIYRSILPMDASILSFIVSQSLRQSFRFQLIADLKRQGLGFNFAEVLAILFHLQRADPSGTENLQDYLLNLYSEKTLIKQLLDDLKASVEDAEKGGHQGSVHSWHSTGLGIISQNNALLSLQEVQISRSQLKVVPSAASTIQGFLHRAPFNRVTLLNLGLLLGIPLTECL
jgi:hypothetical protein